MLEAIVDSHVFIQVNIVLLAVRQTLASSIKDSGPPFSPGVFGEGEGGTFGECSKNTLAITFGN